MKEAGALDVYFEDTIEILTAEPGALDRAAVERILAEREIGFTRFQELLRR